MMMKANSMIRIGWRGVILFIAVSVALPSAYCQTDGTAVLLRQSPAQGGKITPGPGIHYFEPHTEVALTAEPAPGYQFVYWLGDVGEPTVNSTVTYLDAPKIIIAVFERISFDFLPALQQPQGAPLGGTFSKAADYSRGGISPVAGKRPHKFRGPTLPVEEPDEPIDFPVPEEGNNFPIPEPIPEPATFCLLGLGAGFLLSGRRRRCRQS